MKNKILSLLILSFFAIESLSAQNPQQKKDPVGQWKFEAPYAPEGYTTGNIVVGLTDKKYSASMAFTGVDYKFIGENIKVVKDSVYFSIYIEDESIKVKLKVEDEAKMTGSATYSGGVVPLSLVKEKIEAVK